MTVLVCDRCERLLPTGTKQCPDCESYGPFIEQGLIRAYLGAFNRRLHYWLQRCDKCHWRRSRWWYGPGTGERCEFCVPRGCSCNLEPADGDYNNPDPANLVEELDEKGRKYPCCEWMYCGEGYWAWLSSMVWYKLTGEFSVDAVLVQHKWTAWLVRPHKEKSDESV